jgi:hypothetical protein
LQETNNIKHRTYKWERTSEETSGIPEFGEDFRGKPTPGPFRKKYQIPQMRVKITLDSPTNTGIQNPYLHFSQGTRGLGVMTSTGTTKISTSLLFSFREKRLIENRNNIGCSRQVRSCVFVYLLCVEMEKD